MEFWTEPQMASIHKMLNPRSIAIVGATPRMQYGGRFLAAALKAKDRVRVYAVNPRYDEIMGEVLPECDGPAGGPRCGGRRGALGPGARCPRRRATARGRDRRS